MSDPVALWYERCGHPDYQMCDSEAGAVSDGEWLEEAGAGVVLGVQFSDGRALGREEWPQFREAARRLEVERAARLAERAAEPAPPVRKTSDPFTGKPVDADPADPDWVGRPAAASQRTRAGKPA